MRRETRENSLMGVVSATFLLNVLLLGGLLVDIDVRSTGLLLLGWAVLAVGASLVDLSLVTLRRRGTGDLVRDGVYGIVRHPMYVGGMVMFISHPFFGQHWTVALSSAVGAVCCYVLLRSEDQRLVERFGDSYTEYMREVPGVNFLKGMVRGARRR